MNDFMKDASVAVVATLVKLRIEELGLNPDALPDDLNVNDIVLSWLVDKYDTLNANIEKENKDASDKN